MWYVSIPNKHPIFTFCKGAKMVYGTFPSQDKVFKNL